MATFLDLQTEVRTNLIDTPTAVSNLVPTYVKRAIKTIQNRHNFKVMEASVSFTTALSTRVLGAVPSDYKEARGRPLDIPFNNARNFKLVWAPSREAMTPRFGDQDEGRPRVILDALPSTELAARNFEVYPLPDGNSDYSDGQYRLVIPYWKYLTELSADGSTNWFTLNAEEWIIFMATANGFRTNEDETRMALYEQLAANKYQEVVNLDKRLWIAGQEVLAVHTGGANDDFTAL